MEDSIAVLAGLPSRRDALARSLRNAGWQTVALAPGARPEGCALAVVDLADTPAHEAGRTVASLSSDWPVLAIGTARDLPALRAAVERGAAELAIDPGEEELALRIERALRMRPAAASRRAETALIELATAAGETLEPTGVLRAILGWLQRVVPGVDPEIVVTGPDAGGRMRLIRPGPGRSLAFGHAELARRPDLQRILAGERFVHLGASCDPALRELASRMRGEGWVDGAAIALQIGGEPQSALVVRARRSLDDDAIALIRAAASFAGRSLLNARTHDASARERQRLEAAYADRYRELLDANQRLRQLARQKEELLGIVAHELRVPLHAVLGHARLLLEGERGALPAAARESVEAMRSQAARMFELLDDLLDLHALETGRLEIKPQPLDLGLLVREVCDGLRLQAAERDVRLEVRTPPAGPQVAGDGSKLREVAANLVGNAIQFSPRGETVRVAVESAEGFGARLIVSDRGPGIPPDVLAQLITGAPVARQAGAARTRGLGLAIAREITMLHGGKLDAHSEIGAGSTFLVELPRQAAPAERPARIGAPALAHPPARPRVLVIEDDPDVRRLLVDLLEEDHEVLQASDGLQGVRIARERAPDVALLDLFLPHLDGFGTLEELKRDPRTAEMPVLFLSAERDESARVRGLELGAADFIVKPFSAEELRARIARTLRAARQQAQLRTIAQTDALTGLPNYRAFRARLDEELKRARRYRTPLAAVMIDLDNLKPINDRLGHAAGNRAIVALGETMLGQLRETDFAARYGGDEFVLLLPHTTAAEARALAERLRRNIRQVEIDGGATPLRASMGVAALAPGAPASADALIRAADAALYRAKGMGRDRVCVAGEEDARWEAARRDEAAT